MFAMMRRWSERRDDRFRYEFVRQGLRQAFPDICGDLDFESNSQTIMLRTYRPGDELPLPASLEANGLLAMTTYLSALAGTPDGGTVLIDEPETALHPHAVHAMVDLARDWCRKHGLVVLTLTHSPVLLDEFHEDRERLFLLNPSLDPQVTSLANHPDQEWLGHFSPGKLYGQEEVASPSPPRS